MSYSCSNFALVLAAVAGVCTPGPAAAQAALERIMGVGGVQADDAVRGSYLASNGSAAIFLSKAGNLLPGGNGVANVYRFDLDSHELTRVSVVPGSGAPASDVCTSAGISGDGQVVVFASYASNLVTGNTQWSAVYRHDLASGTLTRISEDSMGNQANASAQTPATSGDGRYTVFISAASNLMPGDNNSMSDLFMHDAQTGEIGMLDFNRFGQFPDGAVDWLTPQAISWDGRYVVFASTANDLTPTSGNGLLQVYLVDVSNLTRTLISQAANGGPGDGHSTDPVISPNGRYIAFNTLATNLLPGTTSHLYRYDRLTATLINIPAPVAGDFTPPLASSATWCEGPRVSDAGDVLATCRFATPAALQMLVWNAASTRWRLVTQGLEGPSSFGNGRSGMLGGISADGRRVVLDTLATNLVGGDTNNVSDVVYQVTAPADLIFRDGFD